ncbi:MAG: hypothetical protein MJK10_03950 [Pseudomonadales bacterium]|nr:hypothetical protein [Pseudomonadales bacterium]NRA15225.1 hypothetical protein [Oceanospirillaceae bacterium]
MLEQLRVRALLEKMQCNTATLGEIQTITGIIDPLVVKDVLSNLEMEGVIYFTGQVYGLVIESTSTKEQERIMEITEEMLSKINLDKEQKQSAFDAAVRHAGQQNRPCLVEYAKSAVKALKIIEIQG